MRPGLVERYFAHIDLRVGANGFEWQQVDAHARPLHSVHGPYETEADAIKDAEQRFSGEAED